MSVQPGTGVIQQSSKQRRKPTAGVGTYALHRPRAGATTFSFGFKPRFGINTETARSVLYDCYDPDARAIVPPARLVAQ
jgi:hypothetical protein